jgi:hypothetical protein
MQLQLLHKRSRHLAPMKPAVGMVNDVVAVIVGLGVVRASQAVVCELVVVAGSIRVYKDVLAPARRSNTSRAR